MTMVFDLAKTLFLTRNPCHRVFLEHCSTCAMIERMCSTKDEDFEEVVQDGTALAKTAGLRVREYVASNVPAPAVVACQLDA